MIAKIYNIFTNNKSQLYNSSSSSTNNNTHCYCDPIFNVNICDVSFCKIYTFTFFAVFFVLFIESVRRAYLYRNNFKSAAFISLFQVSFSSLFMVLKFILQIIQNNNILAHRYLFMCHVAFLISAFKWILIIWCGVLSKIKIGPHLTNYLPSLNIWKEYLRYRDLSVKIELSKETKRKVRRISTFSLLTNIASILTIIILWCSYKDYQVDSDVDEKTFIVLNRIISAFFTACLIVTMNPNKTIKSNSNNINNNQHNIKINNIKNKKQNNHKLNKQNTIITSTITTGNASV